MQVTLKPGYGPQTIAATGQTVAEGETVEVDDDLGGSLCEQTGKWAKAKPKPEGNKQKDGEP